MKRDLDLVMRILRSLEGSERLNSEPELEEEDPYVLRYHLGLLEEAGLTGSWNDGSFEPMHREDAQKMGVGYHLTWAGHEFLDASREPSRWNAAKAIATQAGGVSFEVLKSVLATLAKEAVQGYMQR